MNKTAAEKKRSDLARVASALERIAKVFEDALKLAEGFSPSQPPLNTEPPTP